MTAPARLLRVVTLPGDGDGLRLTGVRVDEVAVPEAGALFRELAADPALSVLAVESGVLDGVPEAALRRVAARGLPVVLPFTLPRAAEAGAGRAYVAALIRRAIGYHVKMEDRR